MFRYSDGFLARRYPHQRRTQEPGQRQSLTERGVKQAMQIELPRTGALALALALAIGCGPGLARAPTPAQQSAPAASSRASLTGAVGETQTGLAAYYSHRLHHGRTASGERFNNAALTTAHQTLPYGTKVRV